jgi:hypothetical protein
VLWKANVTTVELKGIGFNPRPVFMRFVVENVTLGPGFLRVLGLSAVSIFQQYFINMNSSIADITGLTEKRKSQFTVV